MTDPQAPRSIGSILKDARERKAVSFEDVHTKIRIHPRVLQLLEDNKFDKLPSPLFVKSFLKSYAEFLEINPGELLEAYEKEGRQEPEQILFIKSAEIREKVRRRSSVDQRFFLVPLLVAAGALAAGAAFFALRAAGHMGVSKAPVSAASKSKPTAIVSQAKAKSDSWIRSAGQGNFPALEKGDPLKLKVKALDNVWLRVTCDGKVLFQSILKKGALETWNAISSVEIWTGNSSNMVLSLNGFSLGSPGKGVVKKLTVTHQGVKIAS